jgi:hypothetical protein
LIDGLVWEERGMVSGAMFACLVGVLSVSGSERMGVKEEESDGKWE